MSKRWYVLHARSGYEAKVKTDSIFVSFKNALNWIPCGDLKNTNPANIKPASKTNTLYAFFTWAVQFLTN
jgi:hypothetical protein